MDLQSTNILKMGMVVSNNDEYDGFRIKVRIFGEDDDRSDSELPLAFPLLPKMMHILPKVGEAVVIISNSIKSPYGQRYYIGPLIHQPQFMNYDGFMEGAFNLHDGGFDTYRLPALHRNPESLGALPQKDEISLLSRGDTDLTLGENEVKLRCGVRITNDDTTDVYFNKTNPTYIKLKYHESPLSNNTKSSATIVSEEINLISTASKQAFNLNTKDDLITDDEMRKIIEEAHALPYGDVLVEFLNIFKKAFNSHTHAYLGLPPVQDSTYLSLNSFNMDTMLSEHVRIN